MKRGVAGFVFALALAIVPWALMNAYMKSEGIIATGKVLAKRETFLLPGGDSWNHVFELTCEYKLLDSGNTETIVQRVDSQLYHSVRAGSPIRVRYSPSPFLRSFAGMGIYLEDSSPLSRLHYGPPATEDMAMTVALFVAAIFGLLAYLAKSVRLAVVAGVIVGACFPVVLLGLCAFVVFPALFWASRRNPGKEYGFGLLAAIVLSVAVVYWRIPRPSPLGTGPIQNSVALVRQLRVVDEVWSNTWETYSGRSTGETIRPSFQMADLEFTPRGATEPIQVLDRFDLSSVPNIREGSSVSIRYSAANPDSAQIAGTTHTYVWRTTAFLSLAAYAVGAIVTFILAPIRRIIKRCFGSNPARRTLTDPNAALDRLSQVDKWQRTTREGMGQKQLEEMVRQRRLRGGRP